MSPSARDHLRGWLAAPRVQWHADATAVLDEPARAPAEDTPRTRPLVVTLAVVLPVVVAALGLWVSLSEHRARAINGASGYERPGGPHGKPLAVGRPWGRACQPIRFTVEEHVPDWVYVQAAGVVEQARRAGVDVTIETRQFMWNPSSLYYEDGQSPATTRRVAIFAHDETPPRLANGDPERIELGWDARVDADGQHEDFTDVQGKLWMQSIGNDPERVRLAIRQLIAMTQGIVSTNRHDSGIARGSTVDGFTARDIAAMKVMSGC